MKIFFISALLLFSPLTKASAAKKVEQDKIYTVEKTSPEIIIGVREAQQEKNRIVINIKRPANMWHVALVRSNLNYHLPSVNSTKLSFSPASVGLIIGQKVENQFFLYKGYFEIAGEWQRFKRESSLGGNVLYSQTLDLYQVDFYQNFNVAWALKHSLFFSVGVGLAPVYLTSEQSVFGNSSSELGFMGMLKANMVMPLTKSFLKNYEMDLALKMGWGKVGEHEISTTAVSLGLNFE